MSAPARSRRSLWFALVAMVAVLAAIVTVVVARGGSRPGPGGTTGDVAAARGVPTPAASRPTPSTSTSTPASRTSPRSTAGRTATPPARPAIAPGDVAVAPARVPAHGAGTFVTVPGRAPAAAGTGRVFRYRLEVEAGLPFTPAAVAAVVQRDLTDPRGWQPIEHVRFERTDGADYDIRLLIASPGTTDSLCLPLDTAGELSCRNGSRVILNALRWAIGIPGYHGDLVAYHAYMVNHEVGHALGNGHQFCTHPGGPAPVMMQQTKGLGACTPNPWPSVHGG
jgi:Protein of unknown function (DUF3152)